MNFFWGGTKTNPDGGTRIEHYYLDGSMKLVSGTAVHPVQYFYGPVSPFSLRHCTVQQVLVLFFHSACSIIAPAVEARRLLSDEPPSTTHPCVPRRQPRLGQG
ncbi:hypothetical protein SBV1_2230001 [Verrucomicrobia bacterium]|nr:hypothetical protein SBV1_2230001 [Verrucomicrobiota bacterium]